MPKQHGTVVNNHKKFAHTIKFIGLSVKCFGKQIAYLFLQMNIFISILSIISVFSNCDTCFFSLLSYMRLNSETKLE